MAHTIGTDIGAFRPVLTRGLIFAAVFAAAYLFAFPMFGVGRSLPVPVRPVASYDAAQAAHCEQFVELARAKFGHEWKRRLDPRETACAQQIQQAWERDWNPREAPDPVLQPTMIARAARPAKIAPPEAIPAHDPETYSFAGPAIITGVGARFASADADQAVANDTGYSGERGRDLSDAAREDRDDGGMGTTEQGHYAPPRDHGPNGDQTDATRALNIEQLVGPGLAHDAHPQRQNDNESDADENDNSRDKALSRHSH